MTNIKLVNADVPPNSNNSKPTNTHSSGQEDHNLRNYSFSGGVKTPSIEAQELSNFEISAHLPGYKINHLFQSNQ
jgi:hypothetical protein